jgi:hypothetical protein
MSSSKLRRSALIGLATVAAMAAVILRPSPGRTDAPPGRYTIPGDGTVHDTATKLIWQQDANLKGLAWANAGPYCAGLTSPAGGGWRLPTVNELASLLDYSRPGSPFIDPVPFPGVPAQSSTNARNAFWSSTSLVGTSVGLTQGAWLVYFESAITQPNPLNVGGAVRCVRDDASAGGAAGMDGGGAAGGGASGSPGSDGGVSVDGAAGSGASGASGAAGLDGGATFQSLSLSTNDLVFDSTRRVLYASGFSPDAGNSVLTIDPASATVTGTLPVEGLPSVLAINDDCSGLYVGISTPAAPPTATPQIDGADSVRRIDLASMTAGPPVSLAKNTTKLSAGQIAAVPGSSTQYLVSRRQPGLQPDFAGLALYDGTTLLAQLDSFYGSGESIAFIDHSTVVGCSNLLSPSELIRYSLSSTAITPGTYVRGVIAGAARTRIAFGSGWIFASDGNAVNAATLAPLGRYGSGLIAGSSTVAPVPDPDGANVWFVGNTALLAFDRTTFQLRRTISLPNNVSNVSRLVRLSPTGFALRTYEAVYLIGLPN